MRGNGLIARFFILEGMPKKTKKRRGERKQDYFSLPREDFLLQVNRLAEPVCDAEGAELVHTEYQTEQHGKILRLYIDKPGGVTIDDCAAVSRQLGDLLDIYLESDDPYSLEVSSPGSNRPLTKQDDFNRFKGNLIQLQSSRPVNGQKKFKGTLMGIKEGMVILKIEQKSVAINFENVIRARLINYLGES